MYSRTVPTANDIPNISMYLFSFTLNNIIVSTTADTPYTTLNGPITRAE